jgi:hypothetical protein
MIRMIALATLLAATFAGPSAFAQTGQNNKPFCLTSGSSTPDCSYYTMAKCEAAKKGSETCVRPGGKKD